MVKNYLQLLKIEHLEGGGYNVDSIIKAIQTFSTWALRVGIAAAGVSLIVGFILYAVVDVDQAMNHYSHQRENCQKHHMH